MKNIEVTRSMLQERSCNRQKTKRSEVRGRVVGRGPGRGSAMVEGAGVGLSQRFPSSGEAARETGCYWQESGAISRDDGCLTEERALKSC